MKNSTQKQKNRPDSVFKCIGIFSSTLLLAASATYIYSPTFSSNAAESSEVEIKLNVSSVIGISTSTDSLNLEANVGSFTSGSIDIDVSTNSQYGYTLTLEDGDNDSSMVHTNIAVSDVLTSTFTGAKTSATMADNTWGFSLDGTSFYNVPTLGSPVALKRTTSPVSTSYDTTSVNFGAKVGATLTAGTYADTVKFTAFVNGVDGNPENGTSVGNPGEVSYGPSTMQGFRCSDTYNVGDSFTLTDARDGNTYTVKKLLDGQCWMTDNLRLGKSTPMTLTSSDSDVASNFELPAAITNLVNNNFTSNNVNIAETYIDSTYGGYYNWLAATAGEGTTSLDSRTTVEHSICPKGWRLPKGYTDGDFWQLYYDYYPSAEQMMDVPNFKYGGFIYAGQIAGNGQGSYARYWSATNTNSSYASSLYFTDNDAMPANSYPKYYAHSVRCIAR